MHRIERVAHTARFFADLTEEALDPRRAPAGPTYAAWLRHGQCPLHQSPCGAA